MRAFKSVYIAVGLLLAAGCLLLWSRGLLPADRELYREAQALSGKMKDMWPGFSFARYPVAFRRGNYEYVLDGGRETRRRAALPVIACTAYRVDGRVEVLVPCRAELDSLGQVAEGLSGTASGGDILLGQLRLQDKSLPDDRCIAILYHEALHALQVERYWDSLTAMQPREDDLETEAMDAVADEDRELSELYVRRNMLLFDVITSPDGSKAADGSKASEGGKARQKWQQDLDNIDSQLYRAYMAKFGKEKADAYRQYRDITEMIEGTARYMEAKTIELIGDSGAFQEYVAALQETPRGKEKYYVSGMGLCLALDKKIPGWKADVFQKGVPLSELLTGQDR